MKGELELTIEIWHDNILRTIGCYSLANVREDVTESSGTDHEYEIVFLHLHLVDGTDSIDGNIDIAPKDLEELATEFPTNRIVLDQEDSRGYCPPGNVRFSSLVRQCRSRSDGSSSNSSSRRTISN